MRLKITSGAYSPDGGSVFLLASLDDQPVELFLDWSIAAQLTGQMQLRVDGQPVGRRSTEEQSWLELLRAAEFSEPYADAHSSLVQLALKRVESQAYGAGLPCAILCKPPDHDSALRACIEANDLKRAIRLYRVMHPESTMRDALAAVRALAASSMK